MPQEQQKSNQGFHPREIDNRRKRENSPESREFFAINREFGTVTPDT